MLISLSIKIIFLSRRVKCIYMCVCARACMRALAMVERERETERLLKVLSTYKEGDTVIGGSFNRVYSGEKKCLHFSVLWP